MKRSDDRVIGKSGDRNGNLTAEARRHGEENFQDCVTETHSYENTHRDSFFPDLPITYDHPITQSLNPCHPERHQATQARGKVEGPRASVPYYAASGSSHHTFSILLQRFKSTGAILFAILREIFDESAYDRFLLRTQRERSVESYRAFMIERDAAAVTKPRCC